MRNNILLEDNYFFVFTSRLVKGLTSNSRSNYSTNIEIEIDKID